VLKINPTGINKVGERVLAIEVDFWRRSARKSRKEKVRNGTIREISEVGKNISDVIE
jgi:hypothetical protein